MIAYLLKANIVFVALYGFFFLCYRRDTFYGHIRWYLLATIVSALTFPLVNISAWLTDNPAAIEVSQYIPDMETVYQYVAIQQPATFVQPPLEYAVEHTVARTFPMGFVLLWCWLPVTVFMTVKRLFQIACIVRLRLCCPQKSHRNTAIIDVDRKIQPFSFFGSIFLNSSLYSKVELDEIVAHEQVHCRKKHTIDILLAEALLCLCWFNPVAWLLRQDLKQNLEFYTDRMTLMHGFDRKHYQYSLLRVSGSAFQIVNHFNFYFNHLKKRIIMINKKNSPCIAAVKYLLVVPALTAVLLFLQMSGLQAAEEYLSEKGSFVNENPAWEEALPATGDNASNHLAEATVDKETVVTKEVVAVSDLSVHTQYSDNGKQIVESSAISTEEGNEIPVSDDNRVLVSGTVINVNDGKTMPGVQVIAEGMSIGTVTDMNGNYSITVPASTMLQFSFPGMYATREVALGNRQIIDVVIGAETQAKEVVVEVRPILRRGGNEQPLIIIDGKEMSEGGLSNLNPNNIQSISILKDQSAITKYGDRGKNGVIIIFTKKTD